MAILALGLPVIVETWFIPEPGDEMGHYLVLHGYDADAGTFTAADSYKGPDRTLRFAEFDALWRVFNRLYVVIYPSQLAPHVTAVWGEFATDSAMLARAAEVARAEIAAGGGDSFAWFNLGSSLAPDDPEAAAAFDEARARGLPWRMMWYQFGAFEAYAAAGRWDDVRALAEANLGNAGNLEESVYWLGRAAEAEDDMDSARRLYDQAVRLNPNFVPALDRLRSLGGGS
jgi:tetratricopeptide (TPR) repeat protein